jgi:soluble lytic murein transglycosylase-like protein
MSSSRGIPCSRSVSGSASPCTIIAGQQLTIPSVGGGGATAFTPASQVTAASTTYTVQPGDTLSGIASQYGVSLDSLITANNLSVQSVLSVGEQLTIPAATAASTSPDQATIEQILTSQALAAGVDPGLVKAVAWQESGWQMVTAFDGGMGVMQLMPDTVTWVSNTLLGYPVNPYDPTDNIRAGVAMLRYFLMYYGNESLALAAYHQGMSSLAANGILPETQSYIDNILALQQRFGG